MNSLFDLKCFYFRVKKEISRIQQDFVKITTTQQKTSYAAEFERDYEEYVKLKKREREVFDSFILQLHLNQNFDFAEFEYHAITFCESKLYIICSIIFSMLCSSVMQTALNFMYSIIN